MGKTKNSTYKKKKPKQILVFDEHLRSEYLTGFSRRKQHRKKVAKEELVTRTKEARREVKAKYREILKKSTNHPLIQDTPQESTPTVYDLPEHTVTVTDVTYVDLSGSDGLRLGQNTFDSEEELSIEDQIEKASDTAPTKHIMKSYKNELMKIELQKQKNQKKKRHGKSKRRGPLKKGTLKRRNTSKR